MLCDYFQVSFLELRIESRRNNVSQFKKVCYFQYEEADLLDVDGLNNTKRADRLVLFFNRVPKVGSQTFMELLRRLSMRNGFSFNRDRVQRVETIRLAPIEQV